MSSFNFASSSIRSVEAKLLLKAVVLLFMLDFKLLGVWVAETSVCPSTRTLMSICDPRDSYTESNGWYKLLRWPLSILASFFSSTRSPSSFCGDLVNIDLSEFVSWVGDSSWFWTWTSWNENSSYPFYLACSCWATIAFINIFFLA